MPMGLQTMSIDREHFQCFGSPTSRLVLLKSQYSLDTGIDDESHGITPNNSRTRQDISKTFSIFHNLCLHKPSPSASSRCTDYHIWVYRFLAKKLSLQFQSRGNNSMNVNMSQKLLHCIWLPLKVYLAAIESVYGCH